MSIDHLPEVPTFEGKPVDATHLKVTTTGAGLEIDAVLHMDDIIRVVIEARVDDIRHKVNGHTGGLVRFQAAKVISASLVPWDEENPEDRGVLRER